MLELGSLKHNYGNDLEAKNLLNLLRDLFRQYKVAKVCTLECQETVECKYVSSKNVPFDLSN